MAKQNLASTVETIAIIGAIGLAIYIVYDAVSGQGKVGSNIGSGIGNELNSAVDSAAQSVWNGSGTGPLDTWGNFWNFLSGNCDSAGNCSGGS